MRYLYAVLLLSTANVWADPLADLKTRLETLAATTPVEAKVAVTRTRYTDGKVNEGEVPATITVEVSAQPAGFQMQVPRATLDQIAQETRNADPEAKSPVTSALEQLSARDLHDYLDAAPKLLKALENASVVSDTQTELNGEKAQLLQLALAPTLSKSDKKYVKDLKASASVWINANGDPVAAEQSVHIKGRAMLVISFEQKSDEQFAFTRVGDRLIVTEHFAKNEGSGGGENGGSETRASIVPTTAASAALMPAKISP